MYRCNECGLGGNLPARVYDHDGSLYATCEHCGSEHIALAKEPCDICGRMLFEGDTAYQAGDLLICDDCLTEVLV